MKNASRVRIIGGGFSGLAMAWALLRRGIPCEVIEARDRLGGMIETKRHPLGSYETAANGLINSDLVMTLATDVGVRLVGTSRTARRRYLWRDGQLRRWPLSVFGTLQLAFGMWRARRRPRLAIRDGETVTEWADRQLGREASRHLLSPALQGVYGSEGEHLSARLVLSDLLTRAPSKAQPRGTVFPERGMGELIAAMVNFVVQQGGVIKQEVGPFKLRDLDCVSIVATPLADVASVIDCVAPQASKILSGLKMLPLMAVQFYAAEDDRIMNGFGALFPRSSGFCALGVLGEDVIFQGRHTGPAERWILGGRGGADRLGLSDDDVVALVRADRLRLGGKRAPRAVAITRWPRALPDYSAELERALERISLPAGLHLIGNYLGGIGLGQILVRAENIARELETKLGA